MMLWVKLGWRVRRRCERLSRATVWLCVLVCALHVRRVRMLPVWGRLILRVIHHRWTNSRTRSLEVRTIVMGD